MKFLICGLGSIGLRHLRNLKELGYNDIIIYSSGKSVMPGVKEETEGLPVFSRLEDALSKKPDVCMITNPTAMHVDIALQAAEAGCHLYIEKPVSHDLTHLEKLKSIVDAKSLITFITYQFRFHPHIEKLKLLVENKENGEALYVTTEWSEYLPDWHPWEDYKQGYSARKDLGGGVLLTQIHPFNYLNYIFGSINDVKINKVASQSLGIDVDDIADIVINFKNNIIGHVHVDFLQKPRVHTMKIVTSTGRYEWNYHENNLKFISYDGSEKIYKAVGFERNHMFLNMLKEFIQCVDSKHKTRFDLSEAIRELELLIS